MANGKPVREVEFRFNKWNNNWIWAPAFWFIEHVVGYHRLGYIAAGDESILFYGKYVTPTNSPVRLNP